MPLNLGDDNSTPNLGGGNFQDKFDQHKGQKSAISGRRLHWRLSTGFFYFFPSIYVQFGKTSPPKFGESSENPVEKIASNPVTSVAVMVFSALKFENAVKQGVSDTPTPTPRG